MYSLDGENFIYDDPPTFTDVGTNTVYYKVDYTFSFQHRQYNSGTWTTDTVTFDTCYGSADVIIHPRPVTVTADSAEKFYDGTPLTTNGYTIAEATDVTGFVEGEGATFAMTSGSTITNPGTWPNVVDPTKTQATGETKLTNYVITYVDGTLTVKDRLLSTPTSVEKVYDGVKETIGVDVTRDSGLPISSGDYTIKYSQYPDDPNSWTNDLSFVNVGVINTVRNGPHGTDFATMEKDGMRLWRVACDGGVEQVF